jgi:CDP-diacylglycerol--glycerol-3-phosphate 3-phosphatidyltransferase
MNLPNKLTVLRGALIPFFILFLLWGEMGLISPDSIGWVCIGRYLALFIFCFASITDYFDGVIARKYNLTTNFGKLMDPLADKLLIMAAYVAFVELDYFDAWVVCVILGREFMVTGLRQIAADQGRVLQADRWGKNKTVAQMVTAIATLLALCIRDTMRWLDMWEAHTFLRKEMEWWMDWTIFVLIAIVVFFTIASGWRYFRANADLLKDR